MSRREGIVVDQLQWNVAEKAQREAQGAAARAKQEQAQAEARATLRQQLPARERSVANAEHNLAKGRAEVAELERQQGEAWATYVRAYHRDTGGNPPRQTTGEVVLLVPMGGMSTDASVPARGEWEQYQEAERRVIKGQAAVRGLEAVLAEQRTALERSRNA